MNVSVVIITLNNVRTIRQVLAAVAGWADEIVVVESALSIPPQIHYMTMDFATYLFALNKNYFQKRSDLFFGLNNQSEYIDNSGLQEHHALYDARLELACFKLISKK